MVIMVFDAIYCSTILIVLNISVFVCAYWVYLYIAQHYIWFLCTSHQFSPVTGWLNFSMPVHAAKGTGLTIFANPVGEWCKHLAHFKLLDLGIPRVTYNYLYFHCRQQSKPWISVFCDKLSIGLFDVSLIYCIWEGRGRGSRTCRMSCPQWQWPI